MTDPTPRPERVTLTDEELVALADLATHHPQSFNEIVGTYGRLLAAREQALREEIAGEIDRAAMILDRSAEWRDGMDEAANTARGETR